MSQNEWEQEEFPEHNPKFRSSAYRSDDDTVGGTAEPTDVVADDVLLQGAEEVTESLAPEQDELTENMGARLLSSLPGDGTETEDVFVVLPETDSIPIVSAEDVTEVGFADDPMDDVTEDVTDEYLAGGGHPDATSLDDLTTDIDDDLLAMGAEAIEEYSDFDGEDEYELDDTARLGKRRSSGRFVRVALVGFLLLFGAGAVVFVLDPPQLREFLHELSLFVSPEQGGEGITSTVAGGGTSDPAIDPPEGSGDGTGVELVTPPVESGGDDPKVDVEGDPADLLVGTEMDHLAASRQYFRERVILAFQLGYVGEAENEQ